MIWCPIFCYSIYYLIDNKESELMLILALFIVFVFFILILVLSVMIAMIDVVAKQGVQSVYGCTLKFANEQATFPVSLILFILYIARIIFRFQMRLYFNRVLMSTMSLKVLKKPINFENILNVRNHRFL